MQQKRTILSHARLRIMALLMALLSLFFAMGAIFIEPADALFPHPARGFIDACFITAPVAALFAYWILHVRRSWARHAALGLVFIPLTAGLIGLFFYLII